MYVYIWGLQVELPGVLADLWVRNRLGGHDPTEVAPPLLSSGCDP